LAARSLVLYEMAAGRPAYDHPTALAAMHAILYDPLPAEPLAACPAALVTVIRKATEKDPDERYQSAADLAVDLRRIQRALDSGRAGPTAPVASAPVRIAVLPFENLTRAADEDWLSGAFSDSITFGLSPLESLVLIPRESIVDLLRQHDVREGSALSGRVVDGLARVLRVRYYVHGTYERVGDEIRVVARLVDVKSGEIRAQERVTDRAGNLMALQDEVARRVAAALQVAPAIERRETPAPAAYRAVTEGRGLYGAGLFREAAGKAEETVRLDSNYADAWALLTCIGAAGVTAIPSAAKDTIERPSTSIQRPCLCGAIERSTSTPPGSRNARWP
jgi:TolB-like protein